MDPITPEPISSAPPPRPMREELRNEESSGIKLDDLVHAVFCHKWKIVLMTLAGIVAAGVAWVAWPDQFVSEAKILIRYVVESKPVTGMADKEADSQMKSPDGRGENIINSEIEIITSRDLAEQVAEIVGPDRILQGRKVEGDPKVAAGGVISKGLEVDVPRKSNVLRLLFKHRDPLIARSVLNSLTTNYLQKHVEIHRSIGIYDDFLQTKTYELQGELQKYEGQIRSLKTNAGVVSFDEAKKANSAQMSKIAEEKLAAESEIASLLAVSIADNKANPHSVPASNQTAVATSTNLATNTFAAPLDMKSPEFANKAQKYREVCTKISGLEIREMEMTPLYTDEHSQLRNLRAQIVEMKKQKDALEKETPSLLLAPPPTAPGQVASSYNPYLASVVDSNRILSLQAKMNVLTNQYLRLRSMATELDMAETDYLELMRKKELSESGLHKYSSSLEQSRIDKNLGPGNVSNIGIVQTATPPGLDAGKKMKICGGVLASGLFGGLLWAFLLEMFISPAIKRPSDIKDKLKIPIFLWVPIMRNGHKPPSPLTSDLCPPPSGLSSASPLTSDFCPLTSDLSSSPEMRHYYEALRDRLIHYFEIKNLTHKPKLVAITSCASGAGVSTIAAGVAALFSETGDGNVLLVDMNLDQSGGAAAHPFYRGKPGCSLSDALVHEKRENALVQENLYVASVGETNGKLAALMPKKFGTLVPRMKASDYDYIIFDMPPVSQTSIATRLASKMDINLIVISAEADAASKVEEAVDLLKESKANVGGVLNRRQFHVPKQLRHEL